MAFLKPLRSPETAAGHKGSQFILNNTSYSGVDIKILLMSYNTDVYDEQLDYLEQDLGQAEKVLKQRKSVRASTISELAFEKYGTVKWGRLVTTQSTVSKEILQLESYIIAARNRLDRWRQDKNIRGGAGTTKTLAEAQTLSVQTFRDKQAVRACGTVYPKAFTRGPRQIAGSLVFTVFNEHVLYEFLGVHPSDFDAQIGVTSALMDQLPPVDIVIAFANEYGSSSKMAIYGVEFISDGQVMSIEDIMTEQSVSFVARDIDPMIGVNQRVIDENSLLTSRFNPKKGSDLIFEEEYQDVKDSLSPFKRRNRRRSPFL